jgi:hypothetical protein
MLKVKESDKKVEIVDPNTGDKKRYTQVQVRNEIMREVFGFQIRLLTRIVENNDQGATVEARCDALMNGKFVRIANAFGSKTRQELAMNQVKGSCLPYAETSAIGRVLAGLGLSGGEYASLEDFVAFKGGKLVAETVSATKEQLNKINTLLKEKSQKITDVSDYESSDDINYEDAFDIIEKLEKMNKKVTRRTRTNKTTTKTTTKKTTPAKEKKETESKDESKGSDDNSDEITVV